MELQRVKLDNFKRKFYLKYEIKNLIFKSIIQNDCTPFLLRYWSLYNKTKIIRISRKVQHVNKCFETGRARAVFKNTRYNRFKLRFENYNGNLPGFSRASW